jgi:hypothetical protein
MVVVVIPLRVTETSLTMVLAPDEPPADPLLLPADPLLLALEVDWEEPDWDDDAVVDWDDVAVVVDEPMAEIDMESSPEGDIDAGSATSRSACPFNASRR